MSTPAENGDSATWSTFIQRVLTVVAIVGAVLVLSETIAAATQIVLVLFGGVLFGVFLNGLARLLTRWVGGGYKRSLTIVVLVLLALVVAFFVLMAQQISQQVDQFIEQFQKAYEQAIQSLRETVLGRRLLRQMPEAGEALSTQNVQQIGSFAQMVVQQVLFFIGAVAIIFFTGVYLAGDPGRYRNGLVMLFPPSRRPRAKEVAHAVGEALWNWLMGQLAAMTIIGLSTAVGLWLLGVPMPIMLGVITFFLVFVPNIGPIVAIIPQSLLAFQAGGVQLVLYVVVFNIVLQTVESYVITPMIQQYEIDLPAAMIISVQVILGYVAGALGLLFATPLAAAGLVLARMVYIEDVLGDHSAEWSE